MSGPKHTLAQIMEVVRQRPTHPDLEMAVMDFLELPDSEQKVLIFREIVDLSGKINWIIAELQRK